VKSPVYVPQSIAGHVSIDLGRADVGVPQQFLNDPQIGSMFQQMGSEAVPEHVRRKIALDA
jgi:hypothetical protein